MSERFEVIVTTRIIVIAADEADAKDMAIKHIDALLEGSPCSPIEATVNSAGPVTDDSHDWERFSIGSA